MVKRTPRADFHSVYGTLGSPRLAVLVRPWHAWAVRLSAGTGSAIPTPLVAEVDEVGLSRIGAPLPLRTELANNFTLDAGGPLGPVMLNATLFGSEIDDALRVRTDPSTPTLLEIYNAVGIARTRGSEETLRYTIEALHVSLTHFYIDATEPSPEGAGRRRKPLTPRHSASLLAMIEEEEEEEAAVAGQGAVEEEEMRIGFELFYTGAQSLENNPYRSSGRPYVEVGLLVERQFGHVRVFLNGENLTNVRQTRFDPIVRPTPGPGGRMTTDVWAPLAGRVIYGGMRLEF